MKNSPTHSTMGTGVVLSGTLMAGLTNVLAPLAYRAGSNPYTLMAVRYLAFLAICWLVLKIRRQSADIPFRARARSWLGGIFYLLGSGGLLVALDFIPVSLAVLIFFMFPIITIFFECLLDRLWPGWFQIACTATAFAGLMLAMQVETALDWRGVAGAVLGAVMIAASYVWADRRLNDISTTQATFHMAVTCFVIAALVAAVLQKFELPPPGSIGLYAFGGAVLGFVAMFFAQFVGVRAIGAGRTAMLMNLEPVFTIALAAFILSEILNPEQLFGAALVISAVVASQFARR